MKYAKVKKICKDAQSIRIIHDDNDKSFQMVGDGDSFYDFSGMPMLDEYNSVRYFEIKEAALEKFDIECEDIQCYSQALRQMLGDTDPTEAPIERPESSCVLMGTEVVPIFAKGCVYQVLGRYLKPLGDIEDMSFFIRSGSSDNAWLAIKSGLYLRAVIRLTTCCTPLEDFVDRIHDMIHVGVDPETGEVI